MIDWSEPLADPLADALETLRGEVIGFDLGHGETSLAAAVIASNADAQALDIQNQRSFITAVALHPQRGIIIGEEAYTARHLDSLSIRFKSPELQRSEVYIPIKRFVSKVRDLLEQNHLLSDPQYSRFVVGCPSGWPPHVRQNYAALMREAGLKNVEVIAESRAAFIHAKESQELRVSSQRLERSVLIVDIGSSTTDFTAVHRLHERYIDFGDIGLGAGSLDQAILRHSLAKHPQRKAIEAIFTNYPQYRALCELKCRSVKERYFSNEARWLEDYASDSLKIPSPEPIFFDVDINKAVMDKILAAPLVRGKSWPQAFRAALEQAAEQLQHDLPELIFLTGGASRMHFTYQLCQEVFPAALVVRGKEPELSIAKGLALAGRIDIKSQAFRHEVKHFFATGQLRSLVEAHLPALFEAIATALAEALPEQIILPTFRDWQQGHIKTLEALEPTVSSRSEAWLEHGAGREYLAVAVRQWFAQLSPHIEAHINPICDRYGIPRTAFHLDSSSQWQTQWHNELELASQDLWGFAGMDYLSGAIVSILIANITGGGGVALLMSGPVGFAIGLVIGVVTFVIGKQAAEHALKHSDLYLWLRGLARESRIRAKLEENRVQLRANLLASFHNQSNSERIARDVSESIEMQLNQAVEAALVLVR